MIFGAKMYYSKLLDWMSLRTLLITFIMLAVVGYRVLKREAQRRVR